MGQATWRGAIHFFCVGLLSNRFYVGFFVRFPVGFYVGFLSHRFCGRSCMSERSWRKGGPSRSLDMRTCELSLKRRRVCLICPAGAIPNMWRMRLMFLGLHGLDWSAQIGTTVNHQSSEWSWIPSLRLHFCEVQTHMHIQESL